MSAFAKRYELPDPIIEGFERGVADRLLARDPLGALLFARLCWDWADGIPYRGVAALAESVGIGTTYLGTVTRRLEEAGLVRVTRTTGRQLGYELTLPILNLNAADENASYESSGGSDAASYESGGGSPVVQVPRSALKWNLSSDGVSASYVTLCKSGTELALYILRSNNVVQQQFNNVVQTAVLRSNNETTKTGVQNSNVELGAPIGQLDKLPAKASGTQPLVKPSRKKRSRPAGSAGFRQATKEEVLADEQYATIAALHADWCDAFGVQLTLTNWRYAAWRGAINEAGYTPEQLRSAFPAISTDPWWRERPDPHYVFGNNPGKIERFFPANVPATADRFAQRPQSPDFFEF